MVAPARGLTILARRCEEDDDYSSSLRVRRGKLVVDGSGRGGAGSCDVGISCERFWVDLERCCKIAARLPCKTARDVAAKIAAISTTPKAPTQSNQIKNSAVSK